MPGIFDSGLFKGPSQGGSAGGGMNARPPQGLAGAERPPSSLNGLGLAGEKANDSALSNGQPFQPNWSPGGPSMRDVLQMGGQPTAFPGQGGQFPGQGVPNWGGGGSPAATMPGQGMGRPWGY
jgi:hypothetical protein